MALRRAGLRRGETVRLRRGSGAGGALSRRHYEAPRQRGSGAAPRHAGLRPRPCVSEAGSDETVDLQDGGAPAWLRGRRGSDGAGGDGEVWGGMARGVGEDGAVVMKTLGSLMASRGRRNAPPDFKF